jgi:hypothetical protein
MTNEQAMLLKAMIKAAREHRTDPSAEPGVLLNKAISGFSLRTAQVFQSYGIGTLYTKDGKNFIALGV